MINHKLVLKGTSKISLHERFTQLSKFQVKDESHGGGYHREPEVSFVGTGVSRYGRGASANYTRDLSPQMPSLRRPRSVPSYREPSVETERMLYRPSAAVMAANKIKKRSIHQRLGVRARLSMPRYRAGATGLRSWGSEDSVNSGVGAGRRRWGGFVARRRGGYFNRGYGGRWGGFRNRNRWGVFRRGGRGGRFRRGGRGGGRRQPPPPSREQLDNELDSYMAGTKGFLDKQLDDYMMEAANE